MSRSALFAAVALAVAALIPPAAGANEETQVLAFVHPVIPVVLNDQAGALLAQTNATRAAAHLQTLARDPQLDALAASFARTMIARGFFGHTAPDGTTFADRLKSAGISYRFAAENIAVDQDARAAHEAFLHSPGHRDNVMDPRAGRMGVAAIRGGDGETVFVEEFRD